MMLLAWDVSNRGLIFMSTNVRGILKLKDQTIIMCLLVSVLFSWLSPRAEDISWSFIPASSCRVQWSSPVVSIMPVLVPDLITANTTTSIYTWLNFLDLIKTTSHLTFINVCLPHVHIYMFFGTKHTRLRSNAHISHMYTLASTATPSHLSQSKYGGAPQRLTPCQSRDTLNHLSWSLYSHFSPLPNDFCIKSFSFFFSCWSIRKLPRVGADL